MMVATISLPRQLDHASHQAIGVPTIISSTVVMDASSNVSRIGDQSSPTCVYPPSALDRVAELLDDASCLITLEKFKERDRGRVVLPVYEQNSVLTDRRIEFLRYDPARAALRLRNLAKGDEAKFGIAGLHELIGLRDALSLHDPGLKRSVDLERLHCLDSC